MGLAICLPLRFGCSLERLAETHETRGKRVSESNRLLLSAYFSLLTSRLNPSIPALAPVELGDRFEKVFSFKIGPKRLGYIHLGITELPKQEIGNPHFT
jgi:hypothetical protein